MGMGRLVSWTVVLIEGILLAFLGILSLAYPLVSALSLEIFLGSILVVAGIVQGIRAIINFRSEGSSTSLIAAILALLIGILLLKYPLSGVITLSMLLTVYFFVDGITRIINSFELKPTKGWGWILTSGILSLLLAGLIVSGWPISGIWVIGIYLGIYLLFLGFV